MMESGGGGGEIWGCGCGLLIDVLGAPRIIATRSRMSVQECLEGEGELRKVLFKILGVFQNTLWTCPT